MTKKDYIAIAEIIDRCRVYRAHTEGAEGIIDVAEDLASYFAKENPNFDKKRFLAACGV